MWLKEFVSTAIEYIFVGYFLAGVGTVCFIVIVRLGNAVIEAAGGEERFGMFVALLVLVIGIIAAGVKTWREHYG